MLKQRLITARKEMNITQQTMAERLSISQSQYQRREQGEIHIIDEEWERIAQALGKNVNEIKEEDVFGNIYNYDNYSASNNYFYNIPDFIMKNQQEYIEMLKSKIENQESEIELLEQKLAEKQA